MRLRSLVLGLVSLCAAAGFIATPHVAADHHRAPARRLYAEGEGRRVIYVRLTGSDTVGNGSLAKPYRSLERAVLDVPLTWSGGRYVIDLTGMSTIVLPESFYVPPFTSQQQPVLLDVPDWPAFIAEEALTFRAIPTVTATIAQADVTATATDSVTTLVTTITTTRTFAVDGFKGLSVVGAAPFETGIVVGNTATTVTVAGLASAHYPMQIAAPSAELKVAGNVFFGADALRFRNVHAGVTLQGLKLTPYPDGSGEAVSIASGSAVWFMGCDIGGGVANLGGVEDINVDASYVHDGEWTITGFAPTVRNSYVRDINFRVYANAGVMPWVVAKSTVDHCSPIGHGGDAEVSATYDFDHDHIINARSVGIMYYGGGPSAVKQTRIDGSAADAVSVTGFGKLFLDDVVGTGNVSCGVRLAGGGVVQANAGTNVTGAAGDTKTGTIAVATWATVRAAPAHQFFDIASTGDGSRLQAN